MRAFSMMWRVLKFAWDELFTLVAISVLWWAGVALIVTAAPATLGLNAVTNRIANYKRSGTEFFWSEAKRYPGKAWLLFGSMLVALVLILFNLWFYANAEGWWRYISVAWFWVLLFYLMGAQYLFPLLCQQDAPEIRMALRNAAVLSLRAPLYALLALLFHLVLTLICFALLAPIILLWPGLMAMSVNTFMVGLLQEMGLADQPPVLSARD